MMPGLSRRQLRRTSRSVAMSAPPPVPSRFLMLILACFIMGLAAITVAMVRNAIARDVSAMRALKPSPPVATIHSPLPKVRMS